MVMGCAPRITAPMRPLASPVCNEGRSWIERARLRQIHRRSRGPCHGSIPPILVITTSARKSGSTRMGGVVVVFSVVTGAQTDAPTGG